jgi:hypothetical protein
MSIFFLTSVLDFSWPDNAKLQWSCLDFKGGSIFTEQSLRMMPYHPCSQNGGGRSPNGERLGVTRLYIVAADST